MTVSRRSFLTSLGVGSYAMLTNPPRLDAAQQQAQAASSSAPTSFTPIQPSSADRLIVPDGFRCDILCRWNDDMGSRGPYGAEKFGYNCDFLAYFPIDALRGGTNPNEGLLWVNHEYPDPQFVSRYRQGRKTVDQIVREKLSVGGSILHIKRENGRWSYRPGTPQTRRFTALYPRFDFTGPAAGVIPQAIGTLANCSGGRTPWMTALSCEENFQDYNPATGYAWSDVSDHRIDETHYGWVIEVDPFGELPPVKHTALGRFAHENTAWTLGNANKLVVYMGDDAQDQYLYKYVSADPYRADASRADKRRLLTEGTLYVADLLNCRWLPLDFTRNAALRSAGFRDQADVLIRTREAAAAVKATPLDRPEDCEVHPLDKSLYVALTNNAKHGNFYGQILRLIEAGDDPESESFRFEIFLAGGPQSRLACPDNLMFDRAGNLWVACDISSSKTGRGCYESFGNNGFFFVPTRGPSAGDAFQFASGPVQAELTGPCFNENEDTLFLAVQHPGEETRDPANPTSRWPDGGMEPPKPSVVAIQGFRR